MAHAVKVYGVDRILFGSDYPYWTGESYDHAARYMEMAGLGEHDVSAIRSGNASTLLGL